MNAPAESVVWKYVFPEGDSRLEVEVPRAAQIVLFGLQDNVPCVWIERSRGDVQLERRVYRIVGTGHPFPSGWVHRGSAMTEHALYVFHLFEAERGAR